jgi:hypothetical protein
MLDLLRDYKMPLSAVVALMGAFVGAYLWVYSEFVTAAKFDAYQTSMERRILLEKQQQLEAELLKITAKCNAYPKRCDAVDKAMRDKYSRDLQRVQRDLTQRK